MSKKLGGFTFQKQGKSAFYQSEIFTQDIWDNSILINTLVKWTLKAVYSTVCYFTYCPIIDLLHKRGGVLTVIKRKKKSNVGGPVPQFYLLPTWSSYSMSRPDTKQLLYFHLYYTLNI